MEAISQALARAARLGRIHPLFTTRHEIRR